MGNVRWDKDTNNGQKEMLEIKKLTNVSHGLISKLDTVEKINELKDRSTEIALPK